MARRKDILTNDGIARSSRTRLVQKFPSGVRIYSHTIRGMAGDFVVVWPTGAADWNTYQTYQDAKRAVVYEN